MLSTILKRIDAVLQREVNLFLTGSYDVCGAVLLRTPFGVEGLLRITVQSPELRWWWLSLGFYDRHISDCVRRDASFRDRANIFLLVLYVFVFVENKALFFVT
jgi:hypothetical protein